MDDRTFQQRLLEVVFETDLVLERGRIAHALSIPLDEAEAHLDRMASAGILELDSDDDGNLYYVYPRRPPPRPAGRASAPAQLVAHDNDLAARAALAAHHAVRALVHADARARPPELHHDHPPLGRATVTAASVIPGAGHFVRRRYLFGALWLVGTTAAYLLFWPAGIAVHAACFGHAAVVKDAPEP